MIVVTTPTGNIGRQVLEHVLRNSEPIRVIARDPSRLSSHTRERVEVVEGSHGDIEVVNTAFAGTDSVFCANVARKVLRPLKLTPLRS